MRRGVSQTFVLVSADNTAAISGFYTLHPYPVPCFRMGRLARDQRWSGQGIGPLLLGCAVQRCLDAKRSVGGYALVVDAKDAAAAGFYLRHGFRAYRDTPGSLYLPLGG